MVKVKKESILVKPSDMIPSSKFLKVTGVLNPAAIRDKRGNIVLFVRVIEELIKKKDDKYYYSPRLIGKKEYELKIDKFKKEEIAESSNLDFVFNDGTKRLTFISHLRKVILDKSGQRVKSIEHKPSFFGLHSEGELGIEDPRITELEGKYYMTYVTLSRNENISTSLAVSIDLKKWERLGIIFGEQDKDVVLFPERINDEYVIFDRPESNFSFTPPHIWIGYSKDLISWGKLKALHLSNKGDWDYERVGAGPPPLKTKYGWLFIYHGVMNSSNKKIFDKVMKRMNILDEVSGVIRSNDSVYCVGVAMLNLKNPKQILAKSDVPILFPLKKHEISIYENKRVLFPTGLIQDNEDLLIYSGAGDLVVTVKRMSIEKILKKLKIN